MKKLKKWMIIVCALAITAGSIEGYSAEDVMYTGGNGYTECRTVPAVGAALVFGAIAVGAIVAVALQNSSNNHGH